MLLSPFVRFMWHVGKQDVVVKAMPPDQGNQSVQVDEDQLPVPFKAVLDVTAGGRSNRCA